MKRLIKHSSTPLALAAAILLAGAPSVPGRAADGEQPVNFSDEQRLRVLEILLEFADAHGITASMDDVVHTGPIYIKTHEPADWSGEPSATPAYGGGGTAGYVECTLQAHSPHKGTSAGVVKAKSEGNCDFTPTGPGEPPPVIKWDLYMLLNDGGDTVGYADHTRFGYHPKWKANAPDNQGTQVFREDGACVNGFYTNGSAIEITLPGGWYLTNAENPLATAVRSAFVINC